MIVYLAHHGILNQKWGVRNGPPYPLSGGQYSVSEKRAIYKKRLVPNSIYNKKHFDEVLKADETTLSTLSWNKDRLKGADMFFATHKELDKHQYNAMFNKPVPKVLLDDDGKEIGTGVSYKFKINTKLKQDINVASEDSAAEIFKDLYSHDRDFYNFVTDRSRMQDCFAEGKYVFKGYRESRDVLEKLRKYPKYIPNEDEVQTMYRMFNYVIPNDGGGDVRKANDVAKQRAKFFKKCKESGYGAILDTNDAIYGGFKARSPVIVFDMENVVPDKVYETDLKHKSISILATIGRKAVHL